MKALLNKAAAAVSGVVLFAIAAVMVGIGLSAVALLATVGLATAGLALLAAPFAPSTDTVEA